MERGRREGKKPIEESMERGRSKGKQPIEPKERDDESVQSEDFETEWNQIEDMIFNAKKPESSSKNTSTTNSTNSPETKIRILEGFQEDHLFYEFQQKMYEVKTPISTNSSVRLHQQQNPELPRTFQSNAISGKGFEFVPGSYDQRNIQSHILQLIQPLGGGVNLGQGSDSAMLNRDRNGTPIGVNPQPAGTGVFHGPIQPLGRGGVNLGQAFQQPSDSAMVNRDRNGMPIGVDQPSGTGVFHGPIQPLGGGVNLGQALEQPSDSGSPTGTGVFHPLSVENRVVAAGRRGGNNHGHPPLGRGAAGTTQSGRLCLSPKRGGAGSNQPKRGS